MSVTRKQLDAIEWLSKPRSSFARIRNIFKRAERRKAVASLKRRQLVTPGGELTRGAIEYLEKWEAAK
jgi:hypothetical protein